MVKLGCKYQYYDGDERKTCRVIRFKDENTVVLDNCDGTCSAKYVNEINDNMVELTPDAILNLMITSYEDDKTRKDVYACVYRCDSIMAERTEPVLILRQDIYSYMKNPLAMDGKIYVGDCITAYNMPGDEGLMSLCEFSSVDYNCTLYLYSDDTLDDIFECISVSDKKKFNKVLKELHDKNTNPQVVGYCSDLRELFEDNKFIDAYRAIFNITQVDFPIILGDESFNSEGDIILNKKQQQRIEDLLRKYITNIKVIQYDYDIDIKDIVSFKHILISDSTQKIFLIAYEEVGSYPVDEDIANAMLH